MESEYGVCNVCNKEGSLARTYFHYGIKCECCGDIHFEIVWHCAGCAPTKPEISKITLSKELKHKI
jgi:hypothetical protein